MNPSPSPFPVTVVAPPPEWWQIVAALSPLAVLIGAVVAAIIGFRQIKQKREADNRAEWWKRTQWALDAVYSGDDRRGTVGLKVLTVLAESELAGKGELDVLEAAWENPLSEAEKQQTEAVTNAPELGGPLQDEGVVLVTAKGAGQTFFRVGGQAVDDAGVDGEPEPRDNEESDRQDSPEGGAR
ncbi:hypothetical protein [Pseudarthrobacter sp. BIM B-2242]|uniref:hypothetical protein n=1 Tax=Pseudarthrobacter sp. BIM B-2242 TaxID=2772401 RepID=UPI00168A59C4|nr:hypothetical protein [Pseudarthrobacter sp. BIM B-2242]QOD06136.1 hypothetical protein IDT60_21495 [Pseudarthrobacter sp. BIM B-2242]